jgi:hypothetical protein
MCRNSTAIAPRASEWQTTECIFHDDSCDIIKTSRVGNHEALAPVEETSNAARKARTFALGGARTYVLPVVYFLYEYPTLRTNRLL